MVIAVELLVCNCSMESDSLILGREFFEFRRHWPITNNIELPLALTLTIQADECSNQIVDPLQFNKPTDKEKPHSAHI